MRTLSVWLTDVELHRCLAHLLQPLAEQLGRDSAVAILLPRSEMTEATGSKEVDAYCAGSVAYSRRRNEIADACCAGSVAYGFFLFLTRPA